MTMTVRDRSKNTDITRDFARRLSAMYAEAFRIGLYITGHALHEAVKRVGYEMAGTPELYDEIERRRKKLIPR